MSFVKKYIPQNITDYELLNNKLITLTNQAHDVREDYEIFTGLARAQPPQWENYAARFDDWSEASNKYKQDKREYHIGKRESYQSIWKTKVWKDACHYIIALKMFEKKNLICGYCNKIIIEKNGICYCIIRHTDYKVGIFDRDQIIIVHLDCHKKIHYTYIESYCEECNKPTGTSWKTKCSNCYNK